MLVRRRARGPAGPSARLAGPAGRSRSSAAPGSSTPCSMSVCRGRWEYSAPRRRGSEYRPTGVTAGASTVNTPARFAPERSRASQPRGGRRRRDAPDRSVAKDHDAPNAASRLPHYVDAAADDRPPGRFSPVVPTRRVRTIGWGARF